jgi:hypothetical protein
MPYHFRLITHTSLLITFFLLLAACQPAATETPELPTLASFPTLTETEAPTETSTPTETQGPTATETATPTPSITSTPSSTPTYTRTPTITPTTSATVDVTDALIATGTAAAQEAPVISTVTPGGNIAATPQAVADVVITERQFQEEVNAEIVDIPSIQRAQIDFVPGGINVELTALGGQAFITGEVFVSIELTGDFATITIGDITVNAPEPPESYIETINGDFFAMMVNVLSTILEQRLGEEHNLENIVMTDTTMEITLLVPEL